MIYISHNNYNKHNAKLFEKNKYFYKDKYKNLYLINMLFRISNNEPYHK